MSSPSGLPAIISHPGTQPGEEVSWAGWPAGSPAVLQGSGGWCGGNNPRGPSSSHPYPGPSYAAAACLGSTRQVGTQHLTPSINSPSSQAEHLDFYLSKKDKLESNMLLLCFLNPEMLMRALPNPGCAGIWMQPVLSWLCLQEMRVWNHCSSLPGALVGWGCLVGNRLQLKQPIKVNWREFKRQGEAVSNQPWQQSPSIWEICGSLRL